MTVDRLEGHAWNCAAIEAHDVGWATFNGERVECDCERDVRELWKKNVLSYGKTLAAYAVNMMAGETPLAAFECENIKSLASFYGIDVSPRIMKLAEAESERIHRDKRRVEIIALLVDKAAQFNAMPWWKKAFHVMDLPA